MAILSLKGKQLETQTVTEHKCRRINIVYTNSQFLYVEISTLDCSRVYTGCVYIYSYNLVRFGIRNRQFYCTLLSVVHW